MCITFQMPVVSMHYWPVWISLDLTEEAFQKWKMSDPISLSDDIDRYST